MLVCGLLSQALAFQLLLPQSKISVLRREVGGRKLLAAPSSSGKRRRRKVPTKSETVAPKEEESSPPEVRIELPPTPEDLAAVAA